MKFPFIISFRKELINNYNQESFDEMLNYVRNHFKATNVDTISIRNNYISGANDFFNSKIRFANEQMWFGVSWADFEIVKENEINIAKYTFNMTRYLVFFILMCSIFGIVLSLAINVFISFPVLLILILLYWLNMMLLHWRFFKSILKVVPRTN